MTIQLENVIAVGVGGFLGANARYLLSLWLGEVFGRRYPVATFVINFTGSFLLAVFLAWVTRQANLSPMARLLIAVGFFGAYTTFSSYANETMALVQAGEWVPALVYIVGTNVVCILSVLPGLFIGSKL